MSIHSIDIREEVLRTGEFLKIHCHHTFIFSSLLWELAAQTSSQFFSFVRLRRSAMSWLFQLIPNNNEAEAIVELNRGTHFFQELDDEQAVLCIGLDHKPQRDNTLLSIGRRDCDICVPENLYKKRTQKGDKRGDKKDDKKEDQSENQVCSIRIHADTGEIYLQCDIKDAVKLHSRLDKYSLQGLPARRVLVRNRTYFLYLGDAFFQIVWDEDHGVKKILSVKKQTPSPPFQKPGEDGNIDYHELKDFGIGSYGQVCKVVDLASGDHFALKTIHQKSEHRIGDVKACLVEEVKLMKGLKHVINLFPSPAINLHDLLIIL